MGGSGGGRADALVDLIASDGTRAVLVLEAKRSVSWLEDHQVSYVDTTGNMRIVAHTPALYLQDRGADRDPWR